MRKVVFKSALLVLLVLVALGCTCSISKSDSLSASGYKETGKAAFYADKFQGRVTASGERFDQSAYMAAHKSLPLGTRVRVTNIKNGKAVTVRINDRGPFVKGRIIDLSRSAFSRIGNTSAGVINVRIEVLK